MTNPVIHDFGTDKKRIRARARKKAKAGRVEGTRPAPPVAVFEAAEGSPRAALPPVRIFLGTEPQQYAAERVFLYSVAKYRDPGRRYEVHLMKDLAGYARKGWATGFTNYRFVIPWLAGGTGRAIYNDVDQVYLADPAELFDREMGDAALLAIDDEETSVMLMDCAKLSALWGMEGDEPPKPGKRGSVQEAGLWGTMPGIWNARDTEYVAGESKLLHFTTLYKQPWRPFPDVYDYAENENARVWHDLEAEANAARYLPFTREAPSAEYRALEPGAALARQLPRRHADAIAGLVAKTGAKTLLQYGADESARYEGKGVEVTLHDPARSADPGDGFDAAISVDMLQHVPEEDIPWMLDDMFRRASRFVYVGVPGHAAPDGPNACRTVLPPDWWRGQMEMIGAMHPDVSWELHAPTEPEEGGLKALFRKLTGPSGRFTHDAAS